MDTTDKDGQVELVPQRELIEMISAVRALTAEVRETNASVLKLNQDIHGNGKPGLRQEVAELREQLERLELRLKLVYGGVLFVLGPAAAYTVVQVLQFGVDLLTHFGKPPTP